MKKPGLQDYILGNILLLAPLTLLLLALGFHTVTSGGQDWLVSLIALVVVLNCIAANQRVVAYKAWEREWNGMGGAAQPRAPVVPRMPMRIVLATVAWLLLAFASLSEVSTPGMGGWVAMFWLLSAGLGLYGLARLFKRRTPKRAARDISVSVCVAAPARSTSASEAASAVPAYCQALLRHS